MSLGSSDEVSITTGNRLRPGCERIHFNTSSPVFVGSLISNSTQLKCAEGRCSAAMAWSPSPATSISTGMPTFLKANPTKVIYANSRPLHDLGDGGLHLPATHKRYSGASGQS